MQIPNGYDNFVNMHVLADGQWRGDIQTLPTVIPLSDKVAADKYAISYTGLAWDTNPNTKVLKLAVQPGGPFLAPTFENVASQKYPLSRVIYMFINREPGKPVNPVLREFLRMLLASRASRPSFTTASSLLCPPHWMRPRWTSSSRRILRKDTKQPWKWEAECLARDMQPSRGSYWASLSPVRPHVPRRNNIRSNTLRRSSIHRRTILRSASS